MCILPKEPMIYKEQIKTNELIVKLRIFRLVKQGFKQGEVADMFSCHRNTISNIMIDFKTNFSHELQNKLLYDSWKKEELSEILVPLKNKSSRPYHHPTQADIIQEAAVASWLFNERGLKVGADSMRTIIKRRFDGSPDPFLVSLTKLTKRQIRGIYKRYGLKTKRVRSYTGAKIHVHDYQKLSCFQEAHFDTKHILDQKALPEEIYNDFLQKDWLPRYQWTFQLAKPRFRLPAYSRHINSEFGLKYLVFCLMYIRFLFNNWEENINIGMDQGLENCKGSEDKLAAWNQILSLLNAQAYQYHLGNDIKKNLIERSHKTDDTHFYVPRAIYFKDKQSFLQEAAGYYQYFNFIKSHSGIGMRDRTPFEVIKDSGVIKPERLMNFPTMILDDHIHILRKTTDFLLYKAELDSLRAKKKSVSAKEIVDTSQKYEFFNEQNAQKVLTAYRLIKKNR